jgi:tripartite ATP-independent transporter DctP family solute receptor
MKTTTLKTLAVSAGLIVAVAGTAQAQQVLKWGHTYEVGSIYHEAAQRAADAFEEATDGRYEIQVFPASQLGNEAALNDALSIGTVDIIYSGPTFMAQYYGPIVVSAYPFALRDYDHWVAYSQSDLFRELGEGYEAATGNHIASLTYYGTRHVTANEPVLTPADMEDLKIRTPGNPAYQWFPNAAGANATPISFSEVYLALQQGVVDAQENPLPVIQSKRFYEVQSNINLTGHITNSLITLASQMTVDRLGDDYATLEAVLQENALWASNQVVAAEGELAEWFEAEGVTVNTVDRQPFIDLMKEYLDSQEFPFSKDHYERLQAIKG